MYKVKNIHTGQIVTVYAVNGLTFLIYDRSEPVPCWKYQPMNDFEPLEDTDNA